MYIPEQKRRTKKCRKEIGTNSESKKKISRKKNANEELKRNSSDQSCDASEEKKIEITSVVPPTITASIVSLASIESNDSCSTAASQSEDIPSHKSDVDPPVSCHSADDQTESENRQKCIVKVDEDLVRVPPRIRVKSSAELGSSIVFVDMSSTQSAVQSSKLPFKSIGNDTKDLSSKLNVETICQLYLEFFTSLEIQARIIKITEILQELSSHIQTKQDKFENINNSRQTDSEKLMQRHQANNNLNRNISRLQEGFEKEFSTLRENFLEGNYEIRLQLFILGILRLWIVVSNSNEKKNRFRNIIHLLSMLLSSRNDGRIIEMLKAKTFRDECNSLIHFIEQCNETDAFEMLSSGESKSHHRGSKDMSSSPLHVGNQKRASIIPYRENLNVLPCGVNLFRQSLAKKAPKSSIISSVPDVTCKTQSNVASSTAIKNNRVLLPMTQCKNPVIPATSAAMNHVDLGSAAFSASCNRTRNVCVFPTSNLPNFPAVNGISHSRPTVKYIDSPNNGTLLSTDSRTILNFYLSTSQST